MNAHNEQQGYTAADMADQGARQFEAGYAAAKAELHARRRRAMHADLLSRLQRSSLVLRDTAQMRTQLPEWLVIELEQAADDLDEAVKAVGAVSADAGETFGQ